MLKIEFKNATAEDNGYGLEVNGESLEDTISRALGIRSKDGSRAGYGKGFKSNSCDITVIINPHPTTVKVETDKYDYDELDQFLEEVENEHFKKTEKTDQEE